MRGLALLVLAAACLAVGVRPAGAATHECDGLRVCVAVAGPWVVVPTGGGVSRPEVEYQLSCPRAYVVGGLDAELSNRAIDVSFRGALGSPVTPGITTSRAVVFVATYTGAAARVATFRPHIGCIPARGGGARVPTSVSPARASTVWHVRTVRVRPGTTAVAVRCTLDERLVGSSHAFGFYTRTPPAPGLVASLVGSRVTSGGRVVVVAHADSELAGVRAVVQVAAICAGTR